MALRQLAAPTVWPVSLALAKQWVREVTTDNDGVLDYLRKAAVTRAERFTHLSIVSRPMRETLDYFSPLVELSGSPARGVISITYLDTAGVTQTLAASKYRLDEASAIPRLTPEFALFWPPTRVVMNAVNINYDCGILCPLVSVNTGTDTLNAPGHQYIAGDICQFSTDGDTASTLPSPLTAGTVYYVINPVGDTIQLSLTSGGAAIDLTSATPLAGACFCGILEDDFLLAIRLILATAYENRESISAVQNFELPSHAAADQLLWPYKVTVV